jgi:hypothetical protein
VADGLADRFFRFFRAMVTYKPNITIDLSG